MVGPKVAAEVRSLIRRMSLENSLWGAPRIHGELLKLGIEVAMQHIVRILVQGVERRQENPMFHAH